MAEATTEIEEEAPKKASKLPLILALVLALGGGGAAFFAIYSGMILGSDEAEMAGAGGESAKPFVAPDVAFIPLDPMTISLGRASKAGTCGSPPISRCPATRKTMCARSCRASSTC